MTGMEQYVFREMQQKLRTTLPFRNDFFQLEAIEIDQMMEEIAIQVKRKFYTHEVKQEHNVIQRIPANWWEHLKLEKFPRWWKRRWPVQFNEQIIRVSVKRTWEVESKKPFIFSELKFIHLDDEVVTDYQTEQKDEK